MIINTSKLGIHGVRPRSLWVLIPRNPGEIQCRVIRVKSCVSTSTVYMLCFVVIEWVLLKKGVLFFGDALVLVKLLFPTKILIKFLSVLNYKFYQWRSNLSFSSCNWLAPTIFADMIYMFSTRGRYFSVILSAALAQVKWIRYQADYACLHVLLNVFILFRGRPLRWPEDPPLSLKLFVVIQNCYTSTYIALGSVVPGLHDRRMV